MELLLGGLFGVCTVLTSYLFLEAFLEQKKEWTPARITLLIILLGVANNYLAFAADIHFPYPSLIRLALALVRTPVVFYAVTLPLHGSAKKKAVLVLFIFALMTFSELITMLFYRLLFKQPMEQIISDPVMREQIITFSAMTAFMLVAILRYIKLRNNPSAKQKQIFWMELAAPFTSVAVFFYFFASFGGKEVTDLATIVLMMNIMTFLVYARYYKQTREYALRELQHHFKERHYRELEAHQAEIRSMKHDLKNQLIAMNAYVQTGSVERAGAQLDTLISQLAGSGRYAFTPHPGVNGLLSQKHRQAEEEGVLCEFHINLLQETGIADLDLAALVGNILDNALEACRYCEDRRYIRLEIIDRNGLFILKCENSTDGRAKTTRTRKKDAVQHGFGFEKIKQIVENYNGEMQYHFAPYHFEMEMTLFHKYVSPI